MKPLILTSVLFIGACHHVFGVDPIAFNLKPDAGSDGPTFDGSIDGVSDGQTIDSTIDAAPIDAASVDAMPDAMPEDLLFGYFTMPYVCLDGDMIGFVKPSQNPNGPITISITSSAPTFIRVDSPTIPFASSEWMTYQSVTVSGLIETATLISITASAPGLMPKTLTLYVRNCY